MPGGCCEGLERLFDDRVARRDLDRLRRCGPAATTRLLLDALRTQGLAGRSVLDIGGGVGAVHHELLADGAVRATDIDASAAYIEASRDEAERRGTADRMTYLHGDFVELADLVEPADIVTLDRVICCYPDLPALLGRAAGHARQIVAFVYPPDRWWMRAAARAVTALRAVTGLGIYVHRTQSIEAILRSAGFERRRRQATFWWRIDVWERRGHVALDEPLVAAAAR